MARTYIKLKVRIGNALLHDDCDGGVYLDAIQSVNAYDEGRTSVNFGQHCAIINKPLAEVEQMLDEAHTAEQQFAKPDALDWRDISGAVPKPPKKKLTERFPRRQP